MGDVLCCGNGSALIHRLGNPATLGADSAELPRVAVVMRESELKSHTDS
jgi:hypothetical protein